MLSYNETIAISAQQQNPFVENKPYNPDQVLEDVVVHLLDGFYPGPGDSEGADYLKKAYIETLQVLHEKDLEVNENSIVDMREAILTRLNANGGALPSNATTTALTTTSTPTETSTCYATDLKESAKFNLAGKQLIVKKQWIHWAVIALVILILIKIFK